MFQNRITQILFVGVVSWVTTAACVEDTPSIFIHENVSYNEECSIRLDSEEEVLNRGIGNMDVTVARSYRMHIKVENLLSSSSTSNLSEGSIAGTYEANNITLTHALVGIDGPGSGLNVALPQGLEIPISGTIEPGEYQVIYLDVIGDALAEQLAVALDRRGSMVPLTVRIQIRGTTVSGTSVDSNEFLYPLEVCRGCLLSFPVEAQSETDPRPNCLIQESDPETAALLEINASCLPGQDERLDCRECRNILQAYGYSRADIDANCEPLDGL